MKAAKSQQGRGGNQGTCTPNQGSSATVGGFRVSLLKVNNQGITMQMNAIAYSLRSH